MLRATLAVIAPLSARTRPICPSFTCCRPCHRLRSRLFSRGRRPSFLSFCVLRLLAGPYFVPRSKAPLGGSVRPRPRPPRLSLCGWLPMAPRMQVAPIRRADARSRCPLGTHSGFFGAFGAALQPTTLSPPPHSVWQAPLQREGRFFASREARSRPWP